MGVNSNSSIIILETNDCGKVDAVDFFKGFSIFTIVTMHLVQIYLTNLPGTIQKLATIGGTGVQVFFICSGFGLYYSFLKRKVTFKSFIKKRFVKIYIPYIIAVFLSLLAPGLYDKPDKLEAFLSHVFLYKMFIPKYESSFGTQFWYISTLFQLYFLFIVLTKIKDKIGSKWFICFSCICSLSWALLMSITGWNENRVLGSFFLQYLWEFSLGMVIAEMLFQGRKICIKKKYLPIAAILGIVLAIFIKNIPFLTACNDCFALIGYAAIGFIVYSFSLNFRWVQMAVNIISRCSFEWYLTHILIFNLFFFFLSDYINRNFLGIFAFIGSFVAAQIYKKMIDYIVNKSAINILGKN